MHTIKPYNLNLMPQDLYCRRELTFASFYLLKIRYYQIQAIIKNEADFNKQKEWQHREHAEMAGILIR